jgi:lipid A 4'-phosphatase
MRGACVPGREALIRAWLLSAVLAAVLFSAAPGLDVAVSGLFFSGGRFWLSDVGWLDRLRHLLWDASVILILASIAGLVTAHATGRPALWLPGRVWVFVLLLYAAGPGLIVNALLKEYWGRARPANVEAFGGPAQFTAPLWPADQCGRNCSFVSGEAAAAVALGIAIFVMARHLRDRPGPAGMRRVVAAALVLAVTGSLLRLIAGRHFLSDVVFAWLIVAGLALMLDRLILRRNA